MKQSEYEQLYNELKEIKNKYKLPYDMTQHINILISFANSKHKIKNKHHRKKSSSPISNIDVHMTNPFLELITYSNTNITSNTSQNELTRINTQIKRKK